ASARAPGGGPAGPAGAPGEAARAGAAEAAPSARIPVDTFRARANMVGTARWGSLRQFGEAPVPPARPAVAVLACLLLAACTGGNDQAAGPDVSAGGSLRLTVASVPLNCAALPGAPDGCQVGGSAVADGLGKGRVYQTVRLGLPP